jgi:hypothetical protein
VLRDLFQSNSPSFFPTDGIILGGRLAGLGIHLDFQHLTETKILGSWVVNLVIFSPSPFVDGIEPTALVPS